MIGPQAKPAGLTFRYFLGLRPLAGYACCPPPTPDGMPAFGALAGTQTRRLTWGRTRARARGPQKNSSPQARPETDMQQHNVNSSVLWLGSRARACAPEGPKTNAKKARTAQHASQPQEKQNGQNNSPPLSTAVFDGILQHFVERGPSITGMPGSQNARK